MNLFEGIPLRCASLSCRAAEWRVGALLHYCNSSLLQLEDFQMSADAAKAFVLLDRAAAGRRGLNVTNKVLLSKQKSGGRVLEEVPTLTRHTAGVMLASHRSAGPFQLTLRYFV